MGARSKISVKLFMNISNFISIVTSKMGLVCLFLEMSKDFVAFTKVLSMFKAFSLSIIKST
jgi:hypothetical protein